MSGRIYVGLVIHCGLCVDLSCLARWDMIITIHVTLHCTAGFGFAFIVCMRCCCATVAGFMKLYGVPRPLAYTKPSDYLKLS